MACNAASRESQNSGRNILYDPSLSAHKFTNLKTYQDPELRSDRESNWVQGQITELVGDVC